VRYFVQYKIINNLNASLLFFFILNFQIFANTPKIENINCISCHNKEYKEWKNSDHDLSMQIANENSVLGDFNNSIFMNINKIKTKFYKNNSDYMVYTDGVDGKMHHYKIIFTFGVYPLQQYMIKFPDGRVQVLDIAWDSRSKEEGGQRWYSLHPNEKISAKDILHWSGPNLNWNFMCADCHSTHLKKNYNASTDTYDTKYSAINISCIACHTMDEKHQKHMQTKAKRKWIFTANSSTAKLKALTPSKEIQLCAQCHSRRKQLDNEFKAGDNFYDHYENLVLDEDLYFSDGQIKDEVYVYNSFLQSKMYKEGVVCSDCHNPHSLQRKAQADNICFKCHKSDKYTSSKHHKHKQNSPGSSCISCHMPSRTYMGVDERNDHSFRVPRPDLSVNTKIPNACNSCHKDKTALWASNSVKKWYGKVPKGYQTFSHSLNDLRNMTKESPKSLYSVLMAEEPNIAIATAVSYLGEYQNQQTYLTTLQMLKNTDVDIRLNALRALEKFPPKYRVEPVLGILEDKRKVVRIEAARILAPFLDEVTNSSKKLLLNKVLDEYEQTLLFNAERPESQSELALFYLDIKKYLKAEKAFKKAIELEDEFIPAYVNYADYLKEIKQEKRALSVLQEGLSVIPNSGELHLSLGLWYIRDKQESKAKLELQKASLLSPNDFNIQYTYAIFIASTDIEKAISILRKQLELYSGNISLIKALINYYQKTGAHTQELIMKKRLHEMSIQI